MFNFSMLVLTALGIFVAIIVAYPQLPKPIRKIAGGLVLLAVFALIVGLYSLRNSLTEESIAAIPIVTQNVEPTSDSVGMVVNQPTTSVEITPVDATSNVAPIATQQQATPTQLPRIATATAIHVLASFTPAPTIVNSPAPAPTETPQHPATITSTPPDSQVPLKLPFIDNFDLGLKPEWELVQGDPLIVNRHLTYRYETGPLIIRIGDANLNDYTVSFDSVDMVADPAIQVSLGQEWRVNLTHVGASRVRVVWERLKDNGFQSVSQEDPDAARIVGRYQLQVTGDMFILSYNGEIISRALQKGVANRGQIQISLNGGTATSAIDNFKLTAP